MSRRIIQNSAFLKALYYAQPIQRKLMIAFITTEQIKALSEIALKILQGRLILSNAHKEKLKDYSRVIRSLASQRISIGRKKRTLLSFHNWIPLLIKPVLYLLDEA